MTEYRGFRISEQEYGYVLVTNLNGRSTHRWKIEDGEDYLTAGKAYIDFLYDQDEADLHLQARQDNYESEAAASEREYREESYGGTESSDD